MTLSRDSDIEIVMAIEKKNISFDMVDKLFYDYHSECEAIIMDMITDKIDRMKCYTERVVDKHPKI